MFKKVKENKKGFTLAELLIVVAIIAVLVAISIPIFSTQLEKSRDAVTLSNLRAAYAQAQSAALTTSDDSANGVTYKSGSVAGSYTVEVTGVVSKGTAEGLSGLDQLSWLTSDECTALSAKDSLGGTPKSWKITFSYTNDKISSVTAGN